MFLGWGTSVGWLSVFVQSTFITDTDGVGVVSFGVGTNQVFVTCLVCLSIAGDVVMVARETETIIMATDECCYWEWFVAARR